mgnify:CR=1 FL=1
MLGPASWRTGLPDWMPEPVAQADSVVLLVLDGVTDPHNLGACLRSADGAGVDAVIAPRDRAGGRDPFAVGAAASRREAARALAPVSCM